MRSSWRPARIGSRRGRQATAERRSSDRGVRVPRAPLRRCIVTRQPAAKTRLFRFVLGSGRVFVPDLEGRLPGRGIWLSAGRDVIEPARASSRLARAVARAAGGPVQIPVDLLARLEAGLEQRIAELLRSARRAAQAVADGEQARIWAASGCVGLWLDAEGGSASAQGLPREAADLARLHLPPAVLCAAFGRAWVGPVALRHGRLAEAVRNEAGRLAAVRFGWSRSDGGRRLHD